MSYFFGTPANVMDNQRSRNVRKNKLGERSVQNEYELEPVHGSRHRRKHLSKSRSAVRTKAAPMEPVDSNLLDGNMLSPSNKHKRHRNREIERLVDENQRLSSKLESSTTDTTGIMEELNEKHLLLSKAKSKYSKLEKIYQDTKAEQEKLTLLLEQRDTEYRELHIHHEELTVVVQNLEEEKNNLLSTNKRLNAENTQFNEDVSLLKILIYRLNVELERYQDKLRLSKREEDCNLAGSGTEDADLTSENKKISESWGRVNLHALGPLLEAYQENLAEKEDLIKQYAIEMNNFSGRCKDIVAENEALRTEIENLTSQYEKCMEEIKTITEDAAIIKEQNDLLTKQASLQKLKLQEVHSLYEKKVESMSQDNNKLHADYLACTTELSNIRGKYEILSDGYEKLKINTDKTMPVSVHTSAIEECKRLFEELKLQYDSEKKKLTDQLKRLEESNPDNERQLIIVTAERDHLRKQTKNLEKTLKRTQYKFDHLQQNVCSIQVSKESFKRQLNKTTAYCEELVAEQERLLVEREKLMALVKEREKENENIQYLGNNIAHRMGNLKSQLHSVQKGAREQLKSVEKHIKIQELGVGQMKTDYNRELQRLKQLIKQKEDVIGKLQREKYATQDNLELVWRAATSDDKKVKDALKNTKIYNI